MKRVMTMPLRYIVLIFFCGGIMFLTLHFAIGKRIALKEHIQDQLGEVGDAMKNKSFQKALDLMEKIKKSLPEKKENVQEDDEMLALRKEITLKEALVKLKNGDLSDASELLESNLENALVEEKELENILRESYATALYYEAWNDRLTGANRVDWEPIADMARQQFRYLLETKNDFAFTRSVELATRLFQMDLVELKGIPLPEEVEEAQKKEDGKKKEKKSDKGNKSKGKPKNKEDARDKDRLGSPGEMGVPDLSGS